MMIRAALPFVLLFATQGFCQQWLFSNIGNFNPLSSLLGGGNSESFSGGGNNYGNVFTDSDFPMETSGSEPPEVFLRTVFVPSMFGGNRGGGGGGLNRGNFRGPFLLRGSSLGQGGPHHQSRHNIQQASLGSHPFPSFSNFPDGPFSHNENHNNGPQNEGGFPGPFLGSDSIQGPPPNINQPINFNQGPPPNFNQGPPPNFNQGPPPNFNQGQQHNFNQGPPPNFNQGPQPNFNQGPQPNFNQGPPPNFNQGPQPNFNQGQQPNFHHGPPPPFHMEGPFREGGQFSENNQQFPQFQAQNNQNENNQNNQQGSHPQPRGIPIPVSGNVIPVKVQMPQASGQPIIQNALLLLVPSNVPIQGENSFQGNLAAAAAAAGRAAFQLQYQPGQQLERGFRPIPPSGHIQNHANHQMESTIQYHQAHDIPQHGTYVPFSPMAPRKMLKPLQAKKFLASSVKTTTSTQKGNQGSSSNQKKYVAITPSDVKVTNGEILKKVVRVPISKQQTQTGRSMPNTSSSRTTTSVTDIQSAASVEIKTNATLPANKTLSG